MEATAASRNIIGTVVAMQRFISSCSRLRIAGISHSPIPSERSPTKKTECSGYRKQAFDIRVVEAVFAVVVVDAVLAGDQQKCKQHGHGSQCHLYRLLRQFNGNETADDHARQGSCEKNQDQPFLYQAGAKIGDRTAAHADHLDQQ